MVEGAGQPCSGSAETAADKRGQAEGRGLYFQSNYRHDNHCDRHYDHNYRNHLLHHHHNAHNLKRGQAEGRGLFFPF